MFGTVRRRMSVVVATASIAAAVAAAPAGAAGQKTVRCIGNGDFCGATVSIAGGASNRVVTILLTDTNFKRIGVRVIPSASKGAFSITRTSFRVGGSEYRFTLNAVRANPRSARIILLFAASNSVPS